jgi:hypothetical protein
MGTQWVRSDGVVVATTPFTELEAPINVDLAGKYHSEAVWTGENGDPSDASTCTSWVPTAFASGTYGVSSDSGLACRKPGDCSRAFADAAWFCSSAYKLYCMEL